MLTRADTHRHIRKRTHTYVFILRHARTHANMRKHIRSKTLSSETTQKLSVCAFRNYAACSCVRVRARTCLSAYARQPVPMPTYISISSARSSINHVLMHAYPRSASLELLTLVTRWRCVEHMLLYTCASRGGGRDRRCGHSQN